MRTKIKLIFFSDTHIGYDHPVRKKGNKRHRGPDFSKNFHLIIDSAIETKVDFLIHCGDVFERPKIHPALVDQTYQEFVRAANANIQVLIVPGNHERSALPTSIFLSHRNIHIFDHARNYRFDLHHQTLNFSGFPYIKVNARAKLPSILRLLEQDVGINHHNFLLVHHAIDGALAGVHNFEFRNRKDTLDISDLPGKYNYIFSGHIHKHQVLQAKATPIIYTGATERTMYDQINETCGYVLFEIDQTGNTAWEFQPIPLRPMRQIRLNDQVFEMAELKKILKHQMKDYPADTIVQISAEAKETLFNLSKLSTNGHFLETMNVDITGFNHIHHAKRSE